MPEQQRTPPPDLIVERARVWRWREAICADARFTNAEKIVALRLSFHYDIAKRTAWCPEDQLAIECAVHESTVQRARRELVKRGALRVVTAPHRGRATRYALADAWGSALATPNPRTGVARSVPQVPDRVAPAPQWGSASDSIGSRVRYPSSSRSVPTDRGTTGAGPARRSRADRPRFENDNESAT